MLTSPAVQRILTGAVSGRVSATWRQSRRYRFSPRCPSLTFRLAQPPTRDCRTVRLTASATASAAGVSDR